VQQPNAANSIARRLRIAATIALAGLFASSKPAEKAGSVRPVEGLRIAPTFEASRAPGLPSLLSRQHAA